MLINRPADATAYCTSLLSSAPGTVTITTWSSSTTIPRPTTTTQFIGTTTTTAIDVSTFTSDQTVFVKRTQNIVTATPVAALVPLSCSSSVGVAITVSYNSSTWIFTTEGYSHHP
jgi:hypothetical protein